MCPLAKDRKRHQCSVDGCRLGWDRFWRCLGSAFFRLLHALKLESTSQDQTLIEALSFLLANTHRRGVWLPAEVDLSFASEPWQRLVLVRQGTQVRMVRRHFEVCVFSYLAAELKSGDICVLGSDTYADYREQLVRVRINGGWLLPELGLY